MLGCLFCCLPGNQSQTGTMTVSIHHFAERMENLFCSEEVWGEEVREWPWGVLERVASLKPPELKMLREKQQEKLYVSSNHSRSLRQAAYLYTRVNYVRNGKQRQMGCRLPFETRFVWAKMSKVKHISACLLFCMIPLLSLLKDSFDWMNRCLEQIQGTWGHDLMWYTYSPWMCVEKAAFKRTVAKNGVLPSDNTSNYIVFSKIAVNQI